MLWASATADGGRIIEVGGVVGAAVVSSAEEEATTTTTTTRTSSGLPCNPTVSQVNGVTYYSVRHAVLRASLGQVRST
jgi:hypothetical protein